MRLFELFAKVPTSFIVPWFISAAVVAVARLLHAADLGYDLTLQLQAAQHLLQGNGLSIYRAASQNLADPFVLDTLTHFPSGYSLSAAALMFFGIGPGAALKILGTAGTFMGWWGWALLAFAYMSEGWKTRRRWRWIAVLIAIVTPLLFTPPWSGTDIFLWAAIPWVLLLVVRGREEQRRFRLDVLAGILSGAAVLMRYASVFLAGFALLTIVCQARPAVAARRVAAFGLGLLPFAVWQGVVNVMLPARAASPGGISLDTTLETAIKRATDGLPHLTTINSAVFFWVGRRVESILPGGAFHYVGIALALAILLVPIGVAIARRGHFRAEAWHDVRFVATFLFVLLPLFLLLCEVAGSGYEYARDRRHYSQLIPLAVFVVFFIAQSAARGFAVTPVRLAAGAYLALFLLFSVGGVIWLARAGDRGDSRRNMLLGVSQPLPWPSNQLSYEYSPARKHLLAALESDPRAILLTNYPHWFFADPAVDRSRLREIESCDRPWFTHAAGPAHVFVFAVDWNGPVQELYAFANDVPGERAECYERLPPFRLLQRFPNEELKLAEFDLPSGSRVELRDRP